MNRVFKLKASIALFAIIFCQAELRAQSVSPVDTSHVLATNIDTNITKKQSGSILVKSDTALIVKAGATIVQKADTTMVINADPELIRQFNEIVAAKQKQSDQPKQDGNITPVKTDSASKANTFTQTRTNVPPVNKPDDSPASTSGSASTPVSPINAASTVATPAASIATSTVADVAKTDASVPVHSDSNNANTTPANKTHKKKKAKANSNQAANNTPANKPDSAAVQPAQNSSVQQAVSNTNNSSANNPASTETKKADDTPQATLVNTPAVKTDSALTANTDTTKAKKDTTLKKSDTTTMKKDTTLMVTDTTSTGTKAVAAYIEVGGAGLAISGNYDARFHNQRDGWGYRIGAGFFTAGGNTVFTVPFQINYLTGENSMHIELGAGMTFLNSTGTNIGNSKWEFDKITGFIATGTVGFRYQPAQKGLNFRIAFVPILYDQGLIPAGGVSVGFTFK